MTPSSQAPIGRTTRGGRSDAAQIPGPQLCLPASSSSAPPLAWLDSAFPKLALFECTVAACRELTAGPVARLRQREARRAELRGAARDRRWPRHFITRRPTTSASAATAAWSSPPRRAQLGLRLDATFTLVARRGGAAGDAAAAAVAPPLPTPCTVEHALRYYADLRAPVSKQMLALLASRRPTRRTPTGCATSRRRPARPSTPPTSCATAAACASSSARSPPPGRRSARLLELAPKLTPRYYTIASSPLAAGGTVHLTVKVLREPMRGAEAGAPRRASARRSSAISSPAGAPIVFVRPSAFRLPADPAAPVLMVGPGTGVAPFSRVCAAARCGRGAARHPEARPRGRGGAALLWVPAAGDHDFLYADELRAAAQRRADRRPRRLLTETSTTMCRTGPRGRLGPS